jgi:hypothetical protein
MRGRIVRELDAVVLTEDLPEFGLEAGDVGTVVLVHGYEDGYEVEFMTLTGETIAVVSALPAQVRAVGSGEIAHTRLMKSTT